MHESSYWNTHHRGVPYKIQRWNHGFGDIWNYYIYIDLSKIEDKDIANKLWIRGRKNKFSGRIKLFDYDKAPVINDIHMHGGVTWYKKMYNLNDSKVVEIGCDYNHLDDEGITYDVRDIREDVEHSIGLLIKALPELELTK